MSRELVVLSLEAWDSVWRRNQYLVAELCRADSNLRVLFVEPAADPLHQLSRRSFPRPGRGLRRAPAVDGVHAERLWLHQPTKPLPRRMDPRADARLARSVVRAARRIGLDRPVLWVNDPSGVSVLRATDWPALYDVTDDWLAADRPPTVLARVRADEETLLARCMEVTVCSPDLARRKGADRPVTLVTNAVDLARYRTALPRPADLPAGPVAVYVGTVHPDRFDVALVIATAGALPAGARVVVVGPVVDLTADELRGLEAAGVLLLGARPWTNVPAYLQHADVLLVPHVVTAFTDSLDPIKLYEYRAVGLPVVATPVAGFRDTRDLAVTVADAVDFPAAVAAALAARVSVTPASDDEIPTWTGQARVMRDAIEGVAAARPADPAPQRSTTPR